jgi:hypothetical protein
MGKKKKPKERRMMPVQRGPKSELNKLETRIAELASQGKTVPEIARKLAGDDPAEQKRLRQYIRRLGHDEQFQVALGGMAKVESIFHVGPTIKAMGRKARAGRIDAAKLMLEVSGFHNPRVQHDHGGQVEIVIKNAPRPERVTEQYLGDEQLGDIVDAEVVDD